MSILKKGRHQSIPRQSASLNKRHSSEPAEINCCGLQIMVNTGVYATSVDSELMAETVKISSSEDFLEIGCGTGVISIKLAKFAQSGVAVDINTLAVENSRFNARRHNINNLKFLTSNVFENIKGKFDVIVCNPPYTNHDVSDDIDRMYWDPNDEMKRIFFKEASSYLKENGRIYFGWGNFADIDVDLPFKLAEENGYTLVNISEKPFVKNECDAFVLEFKKS